MEDFYSAVEEAKKIEKNALASTPFSGDIVLRKAIDLSPPFLDQLSFEDMLNQYERVEKIEKASKMQIFAAAGAGTQSSVSEEPQKIKTMELETKVKEITAKTLLSVEELGKIEKEPEKPKEAEKDFGLLEFEKEIQPKATPPMELEKEITKDMTKDISFEKQVEPEKEAPLLINKVKKPEISIPEVLQIHADEAAISTYQNIESLFSREWEGVVEESKIKKKMLELTKELFKEKNVSKRERIKLEITVLKNMMVNLLKGRKKATVEAKSYSSGLFDTILASQNTELNKTKENILTETNARIEQEKKAFYEEISAMTKEEQKKRYEKLVFELTALAEHVFTSISRQSSYIVQKHNGEISHFCETVKDPETVRKLEVHAAEIAESYPKDFETIKNILEKNINSAIDSAGAHVFEGEEKVSDETAVLFEINETDENTLLFHLHSNDAELYKKYERNKISRHEALHYAKVIFAREKGLKDEVINKYFGEIEKGEA